MSRYVLRDRPRRHLAEYLDAAAPFLALGFVTVVFLRPWEWRLPAVTGFGSAVVVVGLVLLGLLAAASILPPVIALVIELPGVLLGPSVLVVSRAGIRLGSRGIRVGWTEVGSIEVSAVAGTGAPGGVDPRHALRVRGRAAGTAVDTVLVTRRPVDVDAVRAAVDRYATDVPVEVVDPLPIDPHSVRDAPLVLPGPS